ncbi:MAG: penicillin-binding transpeptidase domain-containing protein [Eubacteriales bacterium]|nr:penicillin-binding transpeptidase domain-containing protein [Lachnospiraceae bacterium]MDO5127712.1 penicillin-binding transpeptidase domain-containing protein [Eubacteriales bacterium]
MIFEILNSIKEVIVDYVKHRLFPVTVVFVVLFSILIRRLFVLQIVEGQDHMDNFIYKSEKTLDIEGVRGNIYDRNGKLIAYNKLSYSLVYSNNPNTAARAEELGISENELKNDILYRTMNILETNGDTMQTDFPIILSATDGYRFTIKDNMLKDFLKNVYAVMSFDELTEERKNSTADMVMDYLCSERMFNVSNDYTAEERLKIVSCRYKLWLNRYQQYMPVTIAFDISDKSNAAIMENCDTLLGMEVSVRSLRMYNDAEYYAHIIGYIGAIDSEELKNYNSSLPDDEKYSGNEMVGKTGIEKYCEATLRGVNGYETMYVDNLGKVIETTDTMPAQAGNDIYLTIDTDLQKYCYNTLEKEIASIILAHLVPTMYAEEGENPDIPIADVYFGLFKNNYLSMEKMADPDATELEHTIYEEYVAKKDETINEIEKILLTDPKPLKELTPEYRNYMEFVCETLSEKGVYNSSMIDHTNQIYVDYSNNQISLQEYLKYAISVQAIDISAIDANTNYYDNDEIYELVCEYALKYLRQDTKFDKQIIKSMIKLSEISGYSVIQLLDIQGVLDYKNDMDYEAYKNNEIDAFEFIQRKIKNLELTPAMLGLDPCSGSVIVTDVNTGDVLAMVTYPSYDINYLTNEVNSEYYGRLLEDSTTPLVNRAVQQKTAPGSTYKPLATIAGMSEGIMDESSYFFCSGTFDVITPEAHCWLLGGHGSMQAERAIQDSCNIYFYNVGYGLATTDMGRYSDAYGLERLNKYADMFGLSDVSGVELPEAAPNMSNRDAVRSCIGQGTNSYTPIQISRYVTTIANTGTCFDLTLIDKVCDSDGNLIEDNSANIRNTIELSDNIWSTVHNGMRKVVQYHTPNDELVKQVNVAVAGKTGTAQESEVRSNHALYISYAPFEAPEVSVTCVIPNGYSSGNARELAGFIYAYLYDPEKLSTAEMSGNTVVLD